MFTIRTVQLANKAYFCAVRINGQRVIALPDSGSDVSIISKRTAEALRLQWLPKRGKLKPYNSEPFEIVGQLTTTITIGDKRVEASFFVVDNYDESALLGVNILALNRIDLSFSKMGLVFEGVVLTKLFQVSEEASQASGVDHHGKCYRINSHKRGVNSDKAFRVLFRIAHDTVMQANQASGVAVKGDYEGIGIDVSVENYSSDPAHEPIMCEKQMVKSDTTVLRIANFSSRNILLKGGLLVAIGIPIMRIHALRTSVVSQPLF